VISGGGQDCNDLLFAQLGRKMAGKKEISPAESRGLRAERNKISPRFCIYNRVISSLRRTGISDVFLPANPIASISCVLFIPLRQPKK